MNDTVYLEIEFYGLLIHYILNKVKSIITILLKSGSCSFHSNNFNT